MKLSVCGKCGEPLYSMFNYTGYVGASQCINQGCRNYGKPQSFKKGIWTGRHEMNPDAGREAKL